MFIVAVPLTLLVITGGMFLLAKTQKENLGNLFKYVSYFIIIAGFLALACTVARGVKRKIMGRQHMERCMPMQMNCMQGGMGMGCCNQMMMSGGGCNHHGILGGGCGSMRKGCKHEMEEEEDAPNPVENPVAPEQKK